MRAFTEVHALAFTPLTPIHIGCGEDFEPTSYVIDGNVLYQFDPSQLSLTEADRRALTAAVNRREDDAIRAVQSFFFSKRTECKAISRLQVPVAAGVAEWYAKRVGQVAQREAGGATVSNQLEIERTAHHPYTGQPYLPGSSLKGSIRTAWLNHIDDKPAPQRNPQEKPTERSSEVEAELLDGRFATDPFRLVKISDAHGERVTARVLFAVDRDKQQRSRNGQRIEKNLFVRREVIAAAQFRALHGEIRFDLLPERDEPEKTPRKDKRIAGLEQLARACNQFYLPRLRADLDLIRRRFADDTWVDGVKDLLDTLKSDFDGGRIMLLRVGRHSGAESVTLEKRRWFQIRGGKRRPTYWSRDATTIWLAAERENSLAELLPFGWLLVETDASRPNEALRDWCQKQRSEAANDGRRPAGAGASREEIVATEPKPVTVWNKAQLRFNRNNGTLTAKGPGNAEANALAPRGEELLNGLPAEIRRKVREGQFVRVTAEVLDKELIAVRASE